MIFDIYTILGLVGSGIYVLNYIGVTTGFIRPGTQRFLYLNFSAPLLILISNYSSFNLPSFIVQLCWLTIGVFGIWRMAQKKLALDRSRCDQR